MSGAAGLSAAKRRRSGGADILQQQQQRNDPRRQQQNRQQQNRQQQMQQQNQQQMQQQMQQQNQQQMQQQNQQQNQQQQRVATVRMPSTSNPMEALKLHDSILGESIGYINSHTTQITTINETLKKIGENENSLHERLSAVEKLLNTLIMKDKLNKGYVEDDAQEDESKVADGSNVADDSKVADGSNVADESKVPEKKQATPSGRFRNQKKGRNNNNVSMKIEEA